MDFVREELVVDGAPLQYKQLEGGFTQPNAGISVQMLQWAKNAAVYDDAAISAIDAGTNPSVTPERRADDFLELYCGNGNFTVAMAPMFRRVLATEVSKVSVAAAKENLVANGVANVDVVRLSSEELTRALDEGKSFERLNGVDLNSFELKTVLVDPPRAGMGPEVTKFVSRFGRIVYISCNPQTLAEDVRALALTHEVRRFAVFDQFQRPDAGAHDRRRQGVGKQIGPRALAQQVDHGLRPCDIAADGPAKRLAQGAGHEIDPVRYAKFFRRSAPGRTNKSGRVAIIHHHNCAVSFRQLGDFGKLCKRSIHAEYAICGDHYKASAIRFRFFQLRVKIRHIRICITIASGFAQSYAIND